MKFLIALFCLFALATAQIHDQHKQPKSFQVATMKNIHTINLPSVNMKRALAEEKAEELKNVAPRYGVPHFVKDNIYNSGTFQTLNDGSRLWKLKYISKGAIFTTVAFNKFKLATGATLHVVEKSGRTFLGAYTTANNKKDKTFAVGPIKGDEFTLELFEPSSTVGQSELSVKSVTHSYKDLFGMNKAKNGRSGTCNINVACPQGKGWEGETASVAVLLQSSGFRFCTGSLVNNLKNDGAQYFLTAAHCGTSPNTWIALFNYQSSTCQRGGPTMTNYTLSGMDMVANHRTTDFHLARLREPIPASYNLFLAGFNAVDEPETGVSAGIHHPSGDNKKIALCRVPLTSSRWGSGPANTHWRVERWAEGTTEPGSSGSPLYDSNKRVVGQLHGGTASCRNPSGWDVYGKIAKSWDIGTDSKSRLKDHLDPESTGKLVCDGVWFNEIRK